MTDKRETFDSEKNPALGIVLARLQQDTSAHKALLGPPEVYAAIYNDISTAYLRGLSLVGRQMGPSDIYALQCIEGLTMQAINPGGPALLSAARGAVIGASVDMAAVMGRPAADGPQEATEGAGPDDTAPTKPEGDESGFDGDGEDAAEVAAVEDALRAELRRGKEAKPE